MHHKQLEHKEYRDKLLETIKKLVSEGESQKRICSILNRGGMKTVLGHDWQQPHLSYFMAKHQISPAYEWPGGYNKGNPFVKMYG